VNIFSIFKSNKSTKKSYDIIIDGIKKSLLKIEKNQGKKNYLNKCCTQSLRIAKKLTSERFKHKHHTLFNIILRYNTYWDNNDNDKA
jgi:hypothetical protein